jgi:hypothetical protein
MLAWITFGVQFQQLHDSNFLFLDISVQKQKLHPFMRDLRCHVFSAAFPEDRQG